MTLLKFFLIFIGMLFLGFLVFNHFGSHCHPEPKGYTNFCFNGKTGCANPIVTYDGYKCKE